MTYFKYRSYYLLFLGILIISSGCFKKENIPDVSHLKEEIEIVRYEDLLFSLDTMKIEEQLGALEAEHPAFSSIFFENLLGLERQDDLEFFYSQLKGFIYDERIQVLKEEVEIKFPDLSNLKSELEQSFAFLRYYFPGYQNPVFYTFLSEYTIQLFLFNVSEEKDGIGIGLDMFLGEDYPYATIIPNNPSFSNYLTRTFNEEHLVRKVMEGVINDIMPDPSQDRLLDYMIHAGKRLYIMDKLMPSYPDSVIMEYTADQLSWCEENELAMWAFFFDEALFYETDANKINKYIFPSPHSPGMPEAAPGRTANYLGWKIVEAFMAKFPDTTMPELLALSDSQKLLELSRFKPKRK